jgi:hypothetical protein
MSEAFQAIRHQCQCWVRANLTRPSQGAILVLEQGNRRLQAFDPSANPVLHFRGQTASTLALEDEGPGVTYLDLGTEAAGYLYVLSYVNNGRTVADYRLDLYDPEGPDGQSLSRTTGVAAARLAVDTFRNVYTLNYAAVATAPQPEPSVSQWVPVTPQ